MHTKYEWKIRILCEKPFQENYRYTKTISLYVEVFTMKLLLFPMDYKDIFIVMNEKLRVKVKL